MFISFRDEKCTRSDGLTVSSGCKPLQDMYRCSCPVDHADCIQKEFCKCEQGYKAVVGLDGALKFCERIQVVVEESQEGKQIFFASSHTTKISKKSYKIQCHFRTYTGQI